MFIFFITLSFAALVCLKNIYDTSIQHKVQPFFIKILNNNWEAVVGQLSAILLTLNRTRNSFIQAQYKTKKELFSNR